MSAKKKQSLEKRANARSQDLKSNKEPANDTSLFAFKHARPSKPPFSNPGKVRSRASLSGPISRPIETNQDKVIQSHQVSQAIPSLLLSQIPVTPKAAPLSVTPGPNQLANSEDRIILEQWVIKAVFNNGKISLATTSNWIIVEGNTHTSDGRYVVCHSSLISERVNRTTLRSKSGRTYILNGEINVNAMLALGYPQDFIDTFRDGFPPNWYHHLNTILKSFVVMSREEKKRYKKQYEESLKRLNGTHDPTPPPATPTAKSKTPAQDQRPEKPPEQHGDSEGGEIEADDLADKKLAEGSRGRDPSRTPDTESTNDTHETAIASSSNNSKNKDIVIQLAQKDKEDLKPLFPSTSTSLLRLRRDPVSMNTRRSKARGKEKEAIKTPEPFNSNSLIEGTFGTRFSLNELNEALDSSAVDNILGSTTSTNSEPPSPIYLSTGYDEDKMDESENESEKLPSGETEDTKSKVSVQDSSESPLKTKPRSKRKSRTPKSLPRSRKRKLVIGDSSESPSTPTPRSPSQKRRSSTPKSTPKSDSKGKENGSTGTPKAPTIGFSSETQESTEALPSTPVRNGDDGDDSRISEPDSLSHSRRKRPLLSPHNKDLTRTLLKKEKFDIPSHTTSGRRVSKPREWWKV
ncbi:hypothetical protein H4219_000405 [Mycoemilia scoparia]|uniref:SANTA domain-containing protein n=1 Tax=Mycoemilia scoparia TaxID=417184 RepID=A0A9W8DX93_9FUNG|nr:hypothetical protein H4219_000405 [Mycoemilia scoparia]